MNKPSLKVDVTLDFPVPVKGADGKEASRDKITMLRPRTLHVKRIAVLIGADFVKALFGSSGASDLAEVDGRKLILDIVDGLFTKAALDELTSIIASMCSEETDFIDQLDPMDFKKLAEGFLDFFPALRSFGSSNTAQTSPQPTAGDQSI